MYGLFVLYWIQKAPVTYRRGFALHRMRPGYMKYARLRVAAWRRYGMCRTIFFDKYRLREVEKSR